MIILCRSYKLWQRWFSEFSMGQDDHNFTRCEHCAIAFLHKNQIFITVAKSVKIYIIYPANRVDLDQTCFCCSWTVCKGINSFPLRIGTTLCLLINYFFCCNMGFMDPNCCRAERKDIHKECFEQFKWNSYFYVSGQH